MSITVYSKPACQRCEATTRLLDKLEANYQVIDVTVDAAAYELVTSLGYQEAPVVITDTGHWSGFRIDQIRAAVSATAQQ